MKKKLLLGIALALLVITLFALTINAQDPVKTWDISATSSDSVVAYLYEDLENAGYYTLKITGNGSMMNWQFPKEVPWSMSGYAGYIKSVIISDNIENIGDYAFSTLLELTNVDLGNGVKAIGEHSLSNAKKITSLVIPDSVISIDKFAFYLCEGITSVVIGNGVQSIGESAFHLCVNLTDVQFGSNLKSIDKYAFYGTKLTNLTIPDSVTTIGAEAFYSCSYLTSVTIGKKTASIGKFAFTNSSLREINVDEENQYFSSKDGVLYSKDGKTLVLYPSSNENAIFAIPKGVSVIGENAFYGNIRLRKILTQDTITKIDSYAFAYSNITSIYIHESVETIGTFAFSRCNSLTIYCEAPSQPSGWDANWNPDNCPVVWGHTHTYENGVCVCGKQSTYVEKWDISAIANDSVFAYLYEDLENAGYYTLVIKGNGKMLDWTSYEYYPWYDYKDNILTVTVENGITNIGNSACHMLTNLSSVSIPSSVTSIGDYSFAFTVNLTNVTIPTTVTSLGNAAFTASGLVNVLVPNSVVTMGEGVFGDCRQLVSVTLPNGLTSIPNSTFYYCHSLEGVTIPSGVTSIGAYAFYGCEGMDTIYISKTVDTVGYQAFYVCYGLTIYCEASSRPANWSDRWVDSNATVVWGHAHSYTYSDNGDSNHNMICADCGYTVTQEHIYNVEERVDATHTEEGYVKYYCVCGKLGETTVLDIIPHEFTELISVDNEYHIRKCACGFEETKEHEFTKNVIVEASHTTVGQTENVCECGFKSMSVVQFIHPLLYGSYTKVVTEPTCTTQGYTTYSCGCGESWIKDYVDAIGHNYISETVDPTCSTEGYTKYTCSNCGDSYSEESEKLSHNFTELIYVDNKYHIRKCACGYEETVEHEFTRYILIEATHTTNGTDEYVCDCGHKYGSVWVKLCPLLLMAKYTVTDPTCTEQGYTTVNCGCGETWTEDYVDALGHNYESQITVAPTVTNCGEEKFTCVNCGDSYTEILDKIVIPDVNNETVTLKDGTVLPIWDTNGDALIWFKSEANQNDGYALYDFVKAQSSEVDYTTSWAGGINGVHANQVGTVTITVKGVTYASSLIVVFNINDPDVVVTTSSHNCVGNSVNCLSGVFKGSTNLEYAYLKSDTVAIQSNAFYGASNLKYVNFVELTELNQIISQGFSGCKSLFDGETLDLSKTKLVTINSGTFNDVPAKAIILPSGIKNLASWAIQGMTKLEEFHIPETVTSFGETMFKNCYGLKKVTGYKALFERGVIDSIQANTFLDCRSLTSIDFPDSYVSIGANAFRGMTAYTDTFRISNNCTSIGSSSFQNTAFETIIVGTGITVIPSHAFRDSSIKNIVLSANITSIGQEAFRTMKNKLVVYYTGNDTEYLKSITVNNYNGVILDASTVYVSADDFDIENKEDKNYVVYGYNFCEAFYNGNHTYDITVVNPTCTENGSTTYTCSVCNISYTEVIEAAGHSYNTVVTKPSCTEQGYTTHTCACGDYYIDNYVGATGHNYNSVVTDPSCEETGKTTYTCVNCGNSYEEEIEATGHSYNTVVIKPTCTEQGYTAYTCECGYTYVDNYVDAKGHSYNSVVTDPSCEETGKTTYTCVNCGYSYEEEIEATGHSYNTVVTEPSCTEQGFTTNTCIICGDSYVDNYVDAKGHTWSSWSETDDETIYVRTCICGAVDYQTVEKEDDKIEVTPDIDKKKDKVKIDLVFDIPTLEKIGIQIIPEIMEQLNNMETEIDTDLGQIILDAIASSKIAGQEGSVNIGIQDITTDKEAKTGHKVFSITVNDENGNPILPPAEADENGTVTLSFKYHKGLTKEQIKIAYRDENGKLEHMEVEKYDPETGEVTFKTTHLSEYVIYTEEAQPEVYLNNIFEFRGYSVNETTGDICYGFVINYEALSAYENTSGNNASIGIVFASYELLDGKQPLDENGNAITLDIGAVVTMDLSEYTYITYEFVLTDITEEIADHKFVISAYVNANGQNTYFQSKGASSTVEGKSYNEIHAIVKEN